MDRKYVLDTEENRQFLKAAREDLIRFGRKFPSPGGSSYHLGDDGTPWPEKNRQCYVTCRMAHVYSIASMLGYEKCDELAAQAIKGLNGELMDKEPDGWYAALTKDNEVVPDKMCYAHAFVILAGCTASLIGIPGAKELLAHALEVYDKYFWNEEDGLSCDIWNTEFTVMDDYRGLNANMHTVEAFLSAADVTGDEKYRVRAGRIISRVIPWAAGNHWRLPEHYTSKWEPDYEFNFDDRDNGFKPYGATPGHGLEWARLITQWALSTYADEPEKAKPYIEAAENLCRTALNDAWDCDGAPGIVYTVDWEGKPIVHDRMHWVLMEAIDTTATLARVTGDKWYADFYAKLMAYMDAYVMDHVNGSFFHQMDRNNRHIDTVWPGKDDLYHAFQATLIPYSEYPALSIAPSVQKMTKK